MFKQKGHSLSVIPDEITPEMRRSARMIYNDDDIEAGSVEMEEMPNRDRIIREPASDDSEEESSKALEDSTSAESSRSNCCLRLFKCGCCGSDHSKKRLRLQKTAEEKARELILYQQNCEREKFFNKWSSLVSLPGNAAGFLVDSSLASYENSAPVFSFVTGLRSMIAIAVNIYFLCCAGKHSGGSKWALFTNGIIFLLAAGLFTLSMIRIGLTAEDKDDSTAIMFLTIMEYAFQISIPIIQTLELGYFSQDQKNDMNRAREVENAGLLPV